MLFIYIDCHVGVPPRNDDELDGVRFLGCARNDGKEVARDDNQCKSVINQ